jgi:hypothetical protein
MDVHVPRRRSRRVNEKGGTAARVRIVKRDMVVALGTAVESGQVGHLRDRGYNGDGIRKSTLSAIHRLEAVRAT